MNTMTDEKLGQGWLFHERFAFAYDKIPPVLAFEAYGKALLMCASGDGRLTDVERTWVVGYFAAFDSPAEVTNALKTFDDTVDFTMPELPSGANIDATISQGDTIANTARRWLVWDALNACAEDGDPQEGELQRVRFMASQVGVTPDVVAQIEQLHKQERDLKAKKFSLLWPDGVPEEYL